MVEISRRGFLGAAAAGAGAVALAPRLRFLTPAESSDAVAAAPARQTFRTGHSNNCDGACGHLIEVEDGHPVMVKGAPFDSATIGGQSAPQFNPRVCLRGLSQIQNTYSPDRIRYPYKRVGDRGSGQWQRISWDEATTTIAQKFQDTQKQYGDKSVWIAPYTGSLSLLEGVVGVGFRLASVIGASAGDFEGDSEGDSAMPAGWNYVLADPDATAGGIFDGHETTDFLNSKVIVLWGNNVAETSIPDWRIILNAKKAGAKLVVVDPRFTPTSAGADMWLPVRPGADTALIDGVINHIITSGLYDATYLQTYTVAPYLVHPQTKKLLRTGDLGIDGDDYVVVDELGLPKAASDSTVRSPQLLGTHQVGSLTAATAFQVLSDTMAKYTPEHTEQLTDIPAAQVTALGELIGRNSPTGIRAGFGLSHWYHGDLTMQAMLTLQAVMGNIGVHGGGVTTFAGGLTTTAFDLGAWWAPEGTTSFSVLEPMQACGAMLDGDPYPVKAAWFMVDNYAQQMSDRNRVQKALRALDFIVVSDYVMSATADLADIVLPACTYLEKTDLLSSNNFYLQYMPKVIDPLWESKSDLDACTLVAQKMGFGQYFDKTADEYLKEILHIGDPKADDNVVGLTWKQLTGGGAPHLNTPTIPYVPFYDKSFPTKSGKIEFYVDMMVPFGQEVCDHQEPIEASPTNALYAKYPLVFLTTHTRFRTHSQYSNLPWLKEVNNGGQGFLEINPKDASARRIGDGDVVRIFNDRGEMKVRARLTEGIKPGVVNCYQGGWTTVKVNHYIEGHPNNLTHQLANPAQAVIPNFPSNAAYFDCLVQVTRDEG